MVEVVDLLLQHLLLVEMVVVVLVVVMLFRTLVVVEVLKMTDLFLDRVVLVLLSSHTTLNK